jgi:hypothetical protein
MQASEPNMALPNSCHAKSTAAVQQPHNGTSHGIAVIGFIVPSKRGRLCYEPVVLNNLGC